MSQALPFPGLFSEHSAQPPAYWLALQVAGVTVAMLGALVMLAWSVHWGAVVTLSPGLPPMKFNTALCLCLNGVAWIQMGHRAGRSALLIASIPGLIGVTTLLEYLTHQGFGIDELLVKAYLTTASPWPGRMTPWAAMGFTLLSGAVICVAGRRSGPSLRRVSCAGFLAGTVSVTAAVALLGYLLDGRAARAWGLFAGMSVHAAIALLTLSSVFVAHLWRATRDSPTDPLRWLPVIGSILSMIVMSSAAALSFSQLEQSAGWRRHSYDVLLSAQSLLGDATDTQRGMRGYVLTQQDPSMSTYQSGVDDALAQVARLQQLTADNPAQHRLASRLARDMDAVVAYSHRLLAVRATSGLDTAVALESTGEGREVMDRLRQDLQQFVDQEGLLLTSRDAQAQTASRNTELLLFLGSGLAAALLVLAHLIVLRGNARRRRAEAQLQQVSALQSAILNSANYAITATDVNGVVTLFNATAERWLGYAAAEVVGKVTPAIWLDADELATRSAELGRPGASGADGLSAFGRLVRTENRYERDWTFRRRDGSSFPGWLSMSALRDPDGRVSGYLGIFSDITERRKREAELRLSEERFRLAIDNAPIGIALVGLDGRWLKVNRALCRMLGYAEGELLATDFQSLTHPDDLNKDLALVKQVLDGEILSYQIEKRYYHQRGHIVPTMLSVSLVRDRHQQPEYFVSQIEDISARLEVDRMKSEFVSIVSHELRTPLTAIRGSLGLIDGGAFGALPEKVASMISMAHQNSERLGRLINDILDVQKIEAGKLEIRVSAIAAAEFLRQTLEINRPYGDKYGVRFELEPVAEGLVVRADPDRLMQILANLLSNAAKFSAPGADVVVRCRRQGARVVFEVVDHGTGIPEDFRARIFQKFAQADTSQARQFEGTGLGLNITRQLVEAMDGHIEFDTVTGQGTTFRFDLPLATERSAQSSTDPASDAA